MYGSEPSEWRRSQHMGLYLYHSTTGLLSWPLPLGGCSRMTGKGCPYKLLHEISISHLATTVVVPWTIFFPCSYSLAWLAYSGQRGHTHSRWERHWGVMNGTGSDARLLIFEPWLWQSSGGQSSESYLNPSFFAKHRCRKNKNKLKKRTLIKQVYKHKI